MMQFFAKKKGSILRHSPAFKRITKGYPFR